jgi:hypothetical protein
MPENSLKADLVLEGGGAKGPSWAQFPYSGRPVTPYRGWRGPGPVPSSEPGGPLGAAMGRDDVALGLQLLDTDRLIGRIRPVGFGRSFRIPRL